MFEVWPIFRGPKRLTTRSKAHHTSSPKKNHRFPAHSRAKLAWLFYHLQPCDLRSTVGVYECVCVLDGGFSKFSLALSPSGRSKCDDDFADPLSLDGCNQSGSLSLSLSFFCGLLFRCCNTTSLFLFRFLARIKINFRGAFFERECRGLAANSSRSFRAWENCPL